MQDKLKQRIRVLLTDGKSLKSRTEIEASYLVRSLPSDAEVTRFAPSPTGFMHIGALFTAMICQYVARQSNGIYILRIEDTDKKREVDGSKELIVSQLAAFGLSPDEGLQADGSVEGSYGPYIQSERREIYLAYALDLLDRGRAYPCFATSEELQSIVKDQQSKKLRPGYYGQWALWRDKTDEEVITALDNKKSFVLRFRSEGSHDNRIQFNDALKGGIEVPENDLDVPLIKSDAEHLPTYHLAHVVDDFLMRVTIIFRGEEWLPSTALHIELAETLGIKPFKYAHTPVISILDPNGGKRKLSKRKDPEADIAFWRKTAYPIKSIKAYLLGLANSNFEDWYRKNPRLSLDKFPFSIEKLGSSRSPLLDVRKLEDYAKDEIAMMPQESFNKQVLGWADSHDKELYKAFLEDPDYTNRVLAIERSGEKPRKDLVKWSDVPEQYGYMFDSIFSTRFYPRIDEELAGIKNNISSQANKTFLELYDLKANKDTWFENLKRSAKQCNFALDKKAYKDNPDNFNGSLADFAKIIRVSLTGKNRTPDLWSMMQIMGLERVEKRLS